ncbi:SDR family oxidoreductase [Kistimonas asteriae]|uniref:SDR family oxidoreductase n=1 Tax=Kistimonas asteriae TaxID=517724 RepID=UPI001BAC99CA|nr:SDR family oxidoreductase [Kistimonas asteriae]
MTKPLVVITGASSGIGEAAARKFSQEGYPLLLLARRLERMESLGLPNTLCRQVDVTDLIAFRAALEEAEGKYGPTDCLINNAGILRLGRMDTQDPQEWQLMFDTNVQGLLNGIHLVLAGMRRRQSGTLINISSVAGRKTFVNHGGYCGTKFAVHAISEGIREEVADDNVRVVTIAPGIVETEILDHTTSDAVRQEYKDWKKDIGGGIRSEDTAEAIWYAYQQPQNVCIREVVLAPTRQQ